MATLSSTALAAPAAHECGLKGIEAGTRDGYRYGGRVSPQLGKGGIGTLEELKDVIRDHSQSQDHARERQECRDAGLLREWESGYHQGFETGMKNAMLETGPRPLPLDPEAPHPMRADSDRNPHEYGPHPRGSARSPAARPGN